MNWKDYDKVEAAVKKLLGKNAKIPSGKLQAANKAVLAHNADLKIFHKQRDDLEKVLLTAKNSLSSMQNSIEQFGDEVTGSDFGLDADSAGNKKKIDQAQKVFQKFFDDCKKWGDDQAKAVQELDKHLMHITSYKGGGT